jgi:AraC family transcriptional regulator, regulatory protein of adaptative response / methylated-DNA-[protein]-cysteine methyltransferase
MMTHMISRRTSEPFEPPNDDHFWRAVLARDRRYDGSFVYAVRSTGIYCRPSCPSRRPRRDQVVFYSRPEAAEQAGFRPCRRCGAVTQATGNAGAELAHTVLRALDSADDAPSLRALSAQCGASPHRLARSFKRLTGLTPREYVDAQRLVRLKASLRSSDNVAAAVYDAGYGSSRAVYERASTQLGMTPGAYRRGGRGMRIGYTIADSPLGRLLVAATDRGVCSVCIGDSDGALKKALVEEYPAADIRLDSSGLREMIHAFRDHLAGHNTHLDLPVDVQATAFQQQVWRELRAIPYGETRSYTDIAHAVGRPQAVRAVAHACASNRVALLIPCHRVVRQDGSLGGYRWGLERKRLLLDRERQASGRKGSATPRVPSQSFVEEFSSKGATQLSALREKL